MLAEANPPACTSRLLDGMQGRNVALARSVLRMDDVRGVLRHYHDVGTRDALHSLLRSRNRVTSCFKRAVEMSSVQTV